LPRWSCSYPSATWREGSGATVWLGFAFGLWDIGYYVWLRVLIGWPATLLDWDILFLIPLRWWGPVLAPVLIAALICVCAALAVVRAEHGQALIVTRGQAGAMLLGSLLALYVFMSDALHALLIGRSDWNSIRPSSFDWPLFLMALALMALPALRATVPLKRRAAWARQREKGQPVSAHPGRRRPA